MGWIDPWVRSDWVDIFQCLVGWVGSTIAKLLKIWKDYVNAFKARLDKIWLHQAVKLLAVLRWVGLGPNFSTCNGFGLVRWVSWWAGLDRVTHNGPMDNSAIARVGQSRLGGDTSCWQRRVDVAIGPEQCTDCWVDVMARRTTTDNAHSQINVESGFCAYNVWTKLWYLLF